MSIPWIDEAVATTVAEFSTTEGGRIVASLGASGSPLRQDLASLFVAALAQRRSPDARQYLAQLAGNPDDDTPAETATPGIADRPKVERPNGSVYYCRKWGKYWDIDVLKKARETNQFVLLLGPPGTGKTAMAEAAFGAEMLTSVINGDTMVGGLLGGWVQGPDGIFHWANGPLLTAVLEGRPILIDEILLANPTVLSVLYPLMDGRNFVDVQENPEIGVVFAKPGFYIIGAANPDAPGAVLAEPLASRFQVHVEVTTDWELALAMGVDERLVETLEGLSIRASSNNADISWAPQFRELLSFMKMEEVFGRPFAVHNLMRLVPKADLEVITTVMAPLLGGLSAVTPAKI